MNVITSHSRFSFFSLLLFILASGCDKNAPLPIKSSSKSIHSFDFLDFTPPVSGTISETDKKITVLLPMGAKVDQLKPTIVLSENATITPASGTVQNFMAPVEYVVIAEDGSSQKYTVNVTVATTVNFTLNPLNNTELEQGGVLLLTGQNFATRADVKVILQHVASGAVIEIKASSGSTSELLFFEAAEDLPVGEYTVMLYVGSQFTKTSDNVKVVYRAPEVTGVDKATVAQYDVITISGKHFSTVQNQVQLIKDGKLYNLFIFEQSATSIKAKLTNGIPIGKFSLTITSNDRQRLFDLSIEVISTADLPKINATDKELYKKGETISITGVNLKKTARLFIHFISTTTTVNQKDEAEINADGTIATYTIPDTFASGGYRIFVEVDGSFSDLYAKVLSIND
jgi:hypothetical protein